MGERRSRVRCIAVLGRLLLMYLVDHYVVSIWITDNECAHACAVVGVPRAEARAVPRLIKTVDHEPVQKAVANATLSWIR